jgi:E3 ubiquitin-protein ligase HECTD2
MSLNEKYNKWTSKFLNKKPDITQNLNHKKIKNNNQDNVPKISAPLNIDSNIIQEQQISLTSCLSSSNNTIHKINCRCCGSLLSYPPNINRIKCLVCNTYFTFDLSLNSSLSVSLPSLTDDSVPLASFKSLNEAIKSDELNMKKSNNNDDVNIHKSFKNVDLIIKKSFSNLENLNTCFISNNNNNNNNNNNYKSLDLLDLKKFYALLIKLPTKRPMFNLLKYSLYLLKHPPLNLKPNQINWILIIFEIPLLYETLIGKKSLSPYFDEISYDIIKRIIGIISSFDKQLIKIVIHFWSKLSNKEFIYKIDFLNLYITFHINRLFTLSIHDLHNRNTEDDINYKSKLNLKTLKELNQEFINNSLLTDSILIANNYNNSMKFKITINSYSDCWHLRTACHLMSYLFYTNSKCHKVDDSCFYNNLVDYINVKQDFDVWQFNNSFIEHEQSSLINTQNITTDMLIMEKNKTYLGISVMNGVYKRSQFTICSYPFLISLSSKINILQHDAKRVMDLKAEQAFISSIIGGKNNDIYFKLSIRRDYIAHDSLKQIQSHPNDVRKLLKVEFINEQGIDAGGLKKEWFLLLIKELFDPKKGLISYNNENKLAYFAITKSKENNELYFLLGVVIGMAIYNSIILDIKFPNLIYKRLLGYSSSINDLYELEPTIYQNLKKIIKLKNVENLDLKFVIDSCDIYGNLQSFELKPNGKNIIVTDDNKLEYIQTYSKFLIDEVVKEQFQQFSNGFRHVMSTNALSLFTPNEIQKLITGDDNVNEFSKFDTQILRSICKYNNCENSDELIGWFWDYFQELSVSQQRKLMRFVTGTDRIPATGITTIQFKITKLIDSNGYSNRLPISHTCFNELCLWEYKDINILRGKMNMAINESKEFALK